MLDPGYVRYMWSIRHDPENPYFGKAEFEMPDKWMKQYRIISDIKDWPSVWTYRRIFHPLDKKNNSSGKYVRRTFPSRFRRWEGFRTEVGTLQDNDQYESRAVHLYSYWQVYSVFEILEASKINVYLDITDKKIFDAVWRGRIPRRRVFRMQLPSYRKYNPGDFCGRNKDFDSLSFYINAIRRAENLIYVIWMHENKNDRLAGC